MVLESLINPFKAEKKPWEMVFIGFLYASVAAFLSLWIFRQYSSLVMVFLTVIASVPLIFATLKVEEKKDLFIKGEGKLLKEHSKALTFFMLYFLGITIAFTLWSVLTPQNIAESLFKVQIQTILDINNKVTGNVQGFTQLQIFTEIFFNNMQVLIFCIIFAFLYGAGAIFILTWNASVIGAAIGIFIRTKLAETSGYFGIAYYGVLKYIVHGTPEILAYFIAGLAGGIISVAVINHDFRKSTFEKVLLDSSDLIIISIGFLLLAALLEVYVTPILF
ncbi:MAG: stage II sporulation protein M [Candidatus Woesearchaeota archaeon]